MGLRGKIIASFVIVIIFSVGVLATYATMNAQDTLTGAVNEDGQHIADSIKNMLSVRQDLLTDILKSNLKVVLNELNELGEIQVLHNLPIQVGNYTVPTLVAGTHRVTLDYALVDKIQKLFGGTSTVFYLQNNELIRVSTNVLKEDGQRAVGTSIKSDSPVYQSIVNKKQYVGRAFVVNAWYITGYEPLFDKNGNVIGAIYVGVKEQDPFLEKVINGVKIGQEGYVYVMDSKGDIIIHPKIKGQNISNTTFAQQIIKEKNGKIQYVFDGHEKIAIFRYFEPWDWYVVATADLDDLHSASKKILNTILVTGLVISIIAFIISFIIANSLVKPINKLKNLMEIASRGDLTVQSDITSKDEIGVLSKSFNTMIDSNRVVIGGLYQAIDHLSSSTVQANEAIEQANLGMAVISKGVDRVAHGAHNNAKILKEANQGIEEVAKTAQHVANSTQLSLEDSAVVAQKAENIRETMNSVSGSVDELDASRKDISNVVEGLVRTTQNISNFVQVIKSIADQTNLLALNAAIEAARAGQEGRGFAVVAEEVRKLAEESSKSAKEIESLIMDIQTQTNVAVRTSERTGETILSTIQEVREAKNKIEEIVEAVGRVNDQIQEMAAAAQEQSALSQEMTASLNEITATVESTAASTQQIASGVQQQASTLQQVGTTTEELNGLSRDLLCKVQGFKI